MRAPLTLFDRTSMRHRHGVTTTVPAMSLAAGADFVNTARGFMFSLGCIQALRCHQNTCPTGVTTHNKRLQRALVVEEKYLRVANYATA